MMNSPEAPSTCSTTPPPVTMAMAGSMPGASLPSVNVRGAMRRPPKLRSSCDACGAAKVRCDKTQPRCGRCSASGITCVYGLSRKFGKAPKKKDPAETNAAGDAVSKLMAKQPRQSRLSCFPDYNSSLSGATTKAVKYEAQSATSSSFGLDENLIPFTPHVGQDMFMPSPDSLNSLTDALSFASPPHSHTAVLQADPRLHGTIDPLDLTFPTSDCSSLSDWIQTDDLMHSTNSDADPAHISSHPPPMSYSSLEAFPDVSLLQTDTHHCQRLAYATLDSLNLKQDGISNGDSSSQTMDKVLSRNKQALNTVRQLLACPCSKSPHLAMLYASITSKVLTWYQLVAGCNNPSHHAMATAATAWGSFPELGRHQPTPPLSASSSPATPFITPMQFSAGAFSVDDEASQEALRRQLLLSELKKAGHFIDMFSIEGQGRGGEVASGKAVDVYSSLGTWLRYELNRIVGMLQS